MERLREREIAPVGEWSLHELLGNTQVLKTIEELSISHPNVQLLEYFLVARVEIEAHMVQPAELILGVNFLSDQLLGHFTLVHQICDHLFVLFTDVTCQLQKDLFGKHFKRKAD